MEVVVGDQKSVAENMMTFALLLLPLVVARVARVEVKENLVVSLVA